MDMRIEFEAAMAKQISYEGYSDFSIEMMFERESDDQYRSIRVNGAYWGWQASRESIVIELPIVSIDMYGARNGYFCANEAIQWTVDAIHAAGIRTK